VLIVFLKKDAELFSEQQPSISFEFCAENIICFVFEYGHGTHSRTCATSSTDHSIGLHDGSKMRTILFKICTFTIINIKSLSIDVCAENNMCFILNMAMAISAEHAPPQQIIAYECMNPRCAQSFSNMHSYNVHRYHERNVVTLCSILTIRQEIVATATRHAVLTNSVIKRIPSKGKQ
jgi:hypothetical protein